MWWLGRFHGPLPPGSALAPTCCGCGGQFPPGGRQAPRRSHAVGITPTSRAVLSTPCLGRRALPPPLQDPVWWGRPPILRLAAGVGTGLLARTASSSSSAAPNFTSSATVCRAAGKSRAKADDKSRGGGDAPGVELPEEVQKSIEEALEDMKEKEPIIDRYMNSALDPWPSDYRGMRPLCEGDPALDGDETLEDAVGRLEDRQVRGPLRDVRYARREIGDHWLVVSSIDVQGHGFVCGLGYAKNVDRAEKLAARQVLDRLIIADDPVQMLLAAAEKVKTHDHHEGASEPARHAAESIQALSDRLQDLALCTFCPCGKAWMSSIALLLPGQDVRVSASSADWDKDTALALCGEVLIGRLRWALKVPHDAAHDPEEWARTVDERVAMERVPSRWRPGRRGGSPPPKHKGPTRETLRVAALGGIEEELRGALEAVLGDEKSRTDRAALLEDAIQARLERRRKAAPQERVGTAPSGSGQKQPLKTKPARRLFSVTSAAKDPRRKSIVGQLPMEKIRREVSAALEEKQVVVVSGGTGSGKSTQLPQFLLDDWRNGSTADGEVTEAPRIVVTQPRRLAAVSIAERVAWERNEPTGRSIGFSVRGSSARPSVDPAVHGSIEFVTTGTLLRRAMDDPLLAQCNTVIVDEVHERDLMADFLLILLREVLPQRPDLRLVLMSATLDVDTFTRYFGSCPVLEVPSAPRFPVQEIHLGDDFFNDFAFSAQLIQAEADGRNGSAQWLASGASDVESGRARANNQATWWGSDNGDTTFLDLMEEMLHRLVPEVLEQAGGEGKRGAKEPKGAILCFLPGWAEIRRLKERLDEGPEADKIWALPLHSSLPKEQQQLVFERSKPGKVKVILGTNIAESSVTVSDVTIVVDSGLQRELTYDPRRQMSFLDTVWVSRSNAVQRKGRAGRVREGRVYRLYTREQLEALPLRPAPQMQRCDLAQSCLQALALGRDPRSFLAKAPDPPGEASVETAMSELAAIDAVGVSSDSASTPRIMPVGEVLTRLPLEPLLGRAMMLGALLGAPELTSALLAVAGGPSPFVVAPGRQKDLLGKRREFCSWSDTLVAMQVLLSWEGRFRQDGERAATQWASSNMLAPSRLRNFSRTKYQLLRDVRRSGLLRGLSYNGALSQTELEYRRQPAKKVRDSSAVEDDADDEDADDEIVEEDGAGLFDSLGDMQDVMEQEGSNAEWLASMRAGEAPDVSAEPLLPAFLCSAYPSNLALRRDSQHPNHVTPSFSPARVSPSSVNSVDDDRGRDRGGGGGPPSWWLYSEMQVSGGRGFLQSTTKVEDWQVALFGGLKAEDKSTSSGSKDTGGVELDSWLTVEGEDVLTSELIKALRLELRQGLAWQALATLRDAAAPPQAKSMVEASLQRARRLWKVTGDALAGRRPSQEDLNFLKRWKLPDKQTVQGDAAAQPTPKRAPRNGKGRGRGASGGKGTRSVSTATAAAAAAKKVEEAFETAAPAVATPLTAEELQGRTVPQLRQMLRGMGLKVSGAKPVLVERCAEGMAAVAAGSVDS